MGEGRGDIRDCGPKKKKRLLGIPGEGKKVKETKSGAQHASNDEGTDIVVF
jgi:hypothetical protein